jgi:hypothetical protein
MSQRETRFVHGISGFPKGSFGRRCHSVPGGLDHLGVARLSVITAEHDNIIVILVQTQVDW